MTTTSLQEAIDAALALLRSVDRSDPDALFDCLVELEMLATDAIADYGTAALLQVRRATAAGATVLSPAA